MTAACSRGVKTETIETFTPSSAARSFAPTPTIAPNDKPGSQMAKATRGSPLAFNGDTARRPGADRDRARRAQS
ncbi:MAG: hypothetical protein ACXWZ8_11580 [Gaiellaceae bacterium]